MLASLVLRFSSLNKTDSQLITPDYDAVLRDHTRVELRLWGSLICSFVPILPSCAFLNSAQVDG